MILAALVYPNLCAGSTRFCAPNVPVFVALRDQYREHSTRKSSKGVCTAATVRGLTAAANSHTPVTRLPRERQHEE